MIDYKHIVKFLKNNKYILILIGIWFLIIITNYTPNTYLTGWDNQHFEFDLKMNFERLLSGAWAEYQGLGAPGAHSHASDMPRFFILFIFSVFLPQNLIRYAYFFLALLVGSLGIYFLMKKNILKEFNIKEEGIISFISALFYMINIGTVQHFIVPFEMFATQYALLPWILYFVVRYIKKGGAFNALIIIMINLLAAPMAYASMLWFAYFLGLTLFLLIHLIVNRNKKKGFRSCVIVILTLIANSFWLFPTLYYAVNHGNSVSEAKTNIIFSEEAFLINQKYANPVDIIQLKGFLFDWEIRNNIGQYDELMGDWISHTQSPIFIGIALLIFSIILLGIIFSIVLRKKLSISIISFFLLGFIMMLGINPPIGPLLFKLINSFDAIEEALRFPFTKFSIILIFSFSIYLGIGSLILSRFVQKITKLQISNAIAIIVVISTGIVYSFPVFNGFFIHKNLRVDIPVEYFLLFSYLKSQDPNTRIANLPINSLFGWYYTNWGYQGSGFLWYGLQQAVLDRDFDRWYDPLEDYYDEMSSAIYSNDLEKFKYVLKKYDINWVLFDESVISLRDPTIPGNKTNNDKELAYSTINEFLNNIDFIELVENFGNLKLFKVNLDNASSYVSSSDIFLDYDVPIFNISNTERKNKLYSFEQSESELTLTKEYQLPNNQGLRLNIPAINKQEEQIIATVSIKTEGSIVTINLKYEIPSITINSREVYNSDTFTEEIILHSTGINRNSFLNINGKLLRINNLTRSLENIGEAIINLNGQNSINVYNSNPYLSQNIDFTNVDITDCQGTDMSNSIIEQSNTSIKLNSFNTILCVQSPKSINVLPNELVILEAEFSSPSKIKPNLCILNGEGCQENETINNLNKKISAYYTSKSGDTLNIGFSFDNLIDNKSREIRYSNAIISQYKQIYSTNFKPTLKELYSKYSINLDKEDSLKVSFIFNIDENEIINKNELIAIFDKSIKPCGIQNPLTSKSLKTSDGYNSVILENNNTTSCINLELNSILEDKYGYLIVINGRNIQGPEPIFAVINQQSKHYPVQDRLFRDTMNNLFTINNVKNGNSQFELYIYNQGIGSIVSENEISGILIKKIPTSWLSNIVIKNNKQDKPITHNQSIEKVGTFMYKVDLNQNSTILNLKQSYEVNWIGIDDSFNLIEKSSQTFNNKVWENKWIVDDEKNIYILYIPQLLQYLGLFFILISIYYLGIIIFLDRKINEKD